MIQILFCLLASAPLVAQESGRRPVPVPSSPPAAALFNDVDPAVAEVAEMRLYDVAHLTGHKRLTAAIADVVDGGTALAGPEMREQLLLVEQLRKEVESTMTSVSLAMGDMMQPAFDEEVNSIVPMGDGVLAVIATSAQHSWLTGFLEQTSNFEGMIDVRARMFLVDRGVLQEIASMERFLPSGAGFAALAGTPSGLVFSETETTALLADLEARSVESVTAPRLLTFPFQEASLSVLDEIAYVQDYEIKTIGDLEVADPVIGTVENGVRFRVRGVPTSSGKLEISVGLEYSVVEQPIETVEPQIKQVGPSRVVVQLPIVNRVELNGRFEVAPSESLVMTTTGFSSNGDGEQVLLFVQIARIDEPPSGF